MKLCACFSNTWPKGQPFQRQSYQTSAKSQRICRGLDQVKTTSLRFPDSMPPQNTPSGPWEFWFTWQQLHCQHGPNSQEQHHHDQPQVKARLRSWLWGCSFRPQAQSKSKPLKGQLPKAPKMLQAPQFPCPAEGAGNSLGTPPDLPPPTASPRGPQNTVVSALMMPVTMAWSSGDMWTILASKLSLSPQDPTTTSNTSCAGILCFLLRILFLRSSGALPGSRCKKPVKCG